MTDRQKSGRGYFPGHLTYFLSQIAAIYQPQTAIDPCCEDVSLIAGCNFVPERHALFRNPTALQDAAKWSDNVHVELKDITRASLNRLYDLVITSVPFGAKERVEGRLRRLDLIVAERCLDIVAPNGVCLIIVPPNFLTAPLFFDWRSRVLSGRSLDAVIELPSGAIFERSLVAGALLVIRHGPFRSVGTYLSSYEQGKTDELLRGIRDGLGHFFVSHEDLRERWDRNFHDPSRKAAEEHLDSFKTKRLEELGDIRRGDQRIAQIASDSGEYLVLTPRHLRGDNVTTSDRDRFVNDDHSKLFSRSLVRPRDVVVSLMRPHTYVYQESDPPAVAGPNVAVVRAHDNEYISTYLNTEDGRELFKAQAERYTTGATIPHLPISDLRNMRIPILPLDDLNAVSDRSIALASTDELEALRNEMLGLKKKLYTGPMKLDHDFRLNVV